MSDQPEPRRPDLEIVCAHGIDGGQTDFVQRFRWRDGVWMPKDTSGEKWNNIGGPEGPFASAEDIADAPVGRQHLNTECRAAVNGMWCRYKVPMEWDRGQIALTRLWTQAKTLIAALGIEDTGAPLRFTLLQLRNAYDSVPKAARRNNPL